MVALRSENVSLLCLHSLAHEVDFRHPFLFRMKKKAYLPILIFVVLAIVLVHLVLQIQPPLLRPYPYPRFYSLLREIMMEEQLSFLLF